MDPPSTSSAVNYAFLIHSATTVPQNLPPHVDDRPLARHKRKRTSPEDQAVLETAYRHDPKPDKSARLELVKQVSLGEKEVQIWFQNRRQSSRRKSRPLLPHEIAQYQLSRNASSSSPLVSESNVHLHGDTAVEAGASDEEHGDLSGHVGRQKHGGMEAASNNEDAAPHLSESGQSPAEPSQRDSSNAANEAPTHRHPNTTGMAVLAAHSPTSRSDGHVVDDESRPALRPPQSMSVLAQALAAGQRQHTYLANRRSAPSLRSDQGAVVHPRAEEVIAGNAARSSRLKKSSSFVRLSMSADGNASVSMKDVSSPSPPRASQISVSSADVVRDVQSRPTSHNPVGIAETRTSLQRSSSGRSRDSRTWEFWCDKEARTELEEKAEKEASGSAADAIGLLRSASGRSALGNIPAKRNAHMSRQSTGAKRQRLQGTAPGLQRSFTVGSIASKSKARPNLMYSGSATSIHIPGNESDKENWSPDHEGSIDDKAKPMHTSGLRRSALGDKRKQSNRGSQATSVVRTAKMVADPPSTHDENADPEADPEVAAFMRSGRKSDSSTSEDELDCVQGLLSLSQGNWQ